MFYGSSMNEFTEWTVSVCAICFLDIHTTTMGSTSSTTIRYNPFDHREFHTMFFKRSPTCRRPYVIPTTGADHTQILIFEVKVCDHH